MAKRFTDTDKWRKPWFRSLNGRAKMVWIYLTDNCDHAGFWPAAFDLLSQDLGFDVSMSDFEKWFGDRVQKYGDKYLVVDFIEFQYGVLNPQNRVHKSVLSRFEREGVKPLASPLQGAKDKDKDKDKDKEGGAGETEPTQGFFDDLVARLFVAVKNHPPGDESISQHFDEDWAWIAKTGIVSVIRQAKDDDFARRRFSNTLRIARNSAKTTPSAPEPFPTPGSQASGAESFESGPSQPVTRASSLPAEAREALRALTGGKAGA